MSEIRPGRVSVLMPAWNAERYVREAVASVLGQTHRDLELLVIDDGSTDHTWRILEELAHGDSRLRILRNETNLGIVATRNRAFAVADPSAEHFALMDADDVCLPERLELQVRFLREHPDHALVGGNLVIIDEEGRELGRRTYPSSYEAVLDVLTRANPIAQPTATVRRSAIEAVGGYDVRYPRCQDYDLWMRVASRFKIANLDAFTLKYRVSQTQGKVTQLRSSLRNSLQIQREHMFEPKFFRARNVVAWAAQHGLLLLPDVAILALWKRLTLKNAGG